MLSDNSAELAELFGRDARWIPPAVRIGSEIAAIVSVAREKARDTRFANVEELRDLEVTEAAALVGRDDSLSEVE